MDKRIVYNMQLQSVADTIINLQRCTVGYTALQADKCEHDVLHKLFQNCDYSRTQVNKSNNVNHNCNDNGVKIEVIVYICE